MASSDFLMRVILNTLAVYEKLPGSMTVVIVGRCNSGEHPCQRCGWSFADSCWCRFHPFLSMSDCQSCQSLLGVGLEDLTRYKCKFPGLE